MRITAIAAAVLMVLLPLSICCPTAPQHECCRDRCAMAPDDVPLVAVQVLPLLVDLPPRSVIDTNSGAELHFDRATAPLPRVNPVATIQLRI